eukprot:68531_1
MPSLESYKLETISKLKRRELQSLAKRYQIKANGKNVVLIQQLETKWKEIHEITDYDENTKNKENESTENTNNPHQSAVVETNPEPEPQAIAAPVDCPITNDVEPSIPMVTDSHEEPQFIVIASPPVDPQPIADTTDEEASIQLMNDMLSGDASEREPSTVFDDSNYNANPNGNNGSFLEIEEDASCATAPVELDASLNALRENLSMETYTTHNTINNGSLIHHMNTSTNNINDEESEFSITPQLNKATQEFVRRSLNPDYTEEKEQQMEDDEDVEMEITPYDASERVVSLDREIRQVQMQRTPMLSVPASRITVESDDITMEDAAAQSSSEGSPPSWKQTPLKALQILNAIQDEISMEASTKSSPLKDEDSADETQLEISFESGSQSQDQTETEETQEVRGEISFVSSKPEDTTNEASETASSFVDNLFYQSPVPAKLNKSQHIVEPKSEVSHKDNVRKISMTFGDGQVFAFKSVYSPSGSVPKKPIRRKSTSNVERDTSPEEAICEKTMAIRKMMEEVEETQIQTDNEAKENGGSAVPDWNAIHDKQIFARQPDLSQWDAQRKQRTERLFGGQKKMSTPSYRPRSKSMIGKKVTIKTGQSEKMKNKKRAVMVPSSNDHLFNHNRDSQLNKKVVRQATPYKRNVMDPKARNKKASVKPRFSAFGGGDSDSISEERVVKVVRVPKNKLAFDPDKVKSRLFCATSASANKKKVVQQKRAQTPQVRSGPKNKMMGDKFRNLTKNWSEIKSKINTNNSKSDSASEKKKKANQSVSGIKRKLSWSVNKRQPQQKKRRLTDMSMNNSNTNKWQ